MFSEVQKTSELRSAYKLVIVRNKVRTIINSQFLESPNCEMLTQNS